MGSHLSVAARGRAATQHFIRLFSFHGLRESQNINEMKRKRKEKKAKHGELTLVNQRLRVALMSLLIGWEIFFLLYTITTYAVVDEKKQLLSSHLQVVTDEEEEDKQLLVKRHLYFCLKW